MRLVNQGKKELASERFSRAAHQLQGAIEIDSSNPFAYFYLGLARFRSTRFAEAADLFQRASDLFGEMTNWKADSLAFRGESLEKMNRMAEAHRSFEDALLIDPQNSRADEGLKRVH